MTVPAPLPSNEAQRLARLRELVVLDSEPEAVFDTIARTASEICGVPIALLTLVDDERQWFKANVGLPGLNETPRDIAFCAHAIGSDQVFEVPDATRDARFVNNPLVTAAPDIRFYAGAPLVLPDGERVGTLCVIDRQAGLLSATQKHMLHSLAEITVQALTMRRDLIVRSLSIRTEHEKALAANELFLRHITDSLPVRISYVDHQMRYRFVNLAYCQHFGRPRDQILGRTRSELIAGASDLIVGPKVSLVMAGHAQRFEYADQVRDQLRHVESQLIPDISDDGKVRGFFTTDVDITERRAAEKALRELATILANTTDFVVQTDLRGNLSYMNPAARRIAGIGLDEPIAGRNFSEFNTAETNTQFADVVMPAVAAHGVWVGEATVYAANLRKVPVNHMVIAHRNASGAVDHYSGVMRDISVELDAKQQLLRQSNTLRSVIEATPALMSVIDANQRVRFVNSAYERWAETDRGSVVGRTLLDVLGPEEYERSRAWVERALAGESLTFEADFTAHDGVRHLSISYTPLWDANEIIDGFVSVAQDITQHRQEEVRLLQLSQRDALTGLLNRRGLEQHLEYRLQEGVGPTLALLYIDLDYFKTINDQHGHQTGDRVLQIFAQRLLKVTRPTDGVARLGGDEFAIVLSGMHDEANARAVARKILDVASTVFEVGGERLKISASIGLALGVDPLTGWPDLLARADIQAYAAKASGRGCQKGPDH